MDNETILLDTVVRTKLDQGHNRSRNTNQFQYTDEIPVNYLFKMVSSHRIRASVDR